MRQELGEETDIALEYQGSAPYLASIRMHDRRDGVSLSIISGFTKGLDVVHRTNLQYRYSGNDGS